MPDPNICLLNRKPYWDRKGYLRQRIKCCEKRDSGCLLNIQPAGEQVVNLHGRPIHRNDPRPEES